MTLARLIPLHIHGAVEVVLAPVIMAAPFLLGFGTPAMVASVALGALILGVAFATHADDEGALPVSTHAAFDVCFAVAMGAGAVVFALAGDLAAAAFLSGGSLALILLTSLTRYSASRA